MEYQTLIWIMGALLSFFMMAASLISRALLRRLDRIGDRLAKIESSISDVREFKGSSETNIINLSSRVARIEREIFIAR